MSLHLLTSVNITSLHCDINQKLLLAMNQTKPANCVFQIVLV